MQLEVAECVTRFREARDDTGHPLVVRNSTARPRQVTTGAGPLTLVLIGGRPDGTKEVVALEDGYRESAESWRTLLRGGRALLLHYPHHRMSHSRGAGSGP